jgi:hypothetical protein
MCKKYKIEIDNIKASYEKMDIFKEKFNINTIITKLIVRRNKSNINEKI